MVIGEDGVHAQYRANNVVLSPRSDHWFLRKLDKFLRFIGLPGWTYFWISLKDTVYYPDTVLDPLDVVYQPVLVHELVHILDQRRCWLWLWLLAYGLFPLPVFLAWFRYDAERRAYLRQIEYLIESGVVSERTLEYAVEDVAGKLWTSYVLTWPPFLTREWLYEQLGGYGGKAKIP